jgi:hypothetical protein
MAPHGMVEDEDMYVVDVAAVRKLLQQFSVGFERT